MTDHNDFSSRSFLFLAGLHRSGTSILHRCLNEHPQISGFHDTDVPEDEGQHLQSVIQPAGYYGGPGKFGFRSNCQLTEQSPLATRENATQMFSEWSPYWDLSLGLLMEKSPPNLIRTRFLQSLFPNSHFVVMMRHPVAVALATQKWSRTTLHSLLQHWLVCHELLRDDQPRLQNVHICKYEDFVRDPASTLQSIYRFLGLEPIPPSLEIKQGMNEKYFEQWNSRRRRLFGQMSLNRLVRKFEEPIRSFGYSFDNLGDGSA